MTTFVILAIMALVFAAVLSCITYLWHRKLRMQPYLTAEEGISLDEGSVPINRLLVGYTIAGAVSLLAGFILLHLLVLNPPRIMATEFSITARPITLPPSATRVDLVQNSPQIKVVIDDSEENVALAKDLLKQCADIEITYILPDGEIKCLAEGSAEAQQLLARGQMRQALEQEIKPQFKTLPQLKETMEPSSVLGFQGFVLAAATPTEAAKDVAARSPLDRYAELVYFFLTFLGVFLRTYWDSVQQKTNVVTLSAPTLITSLIIAIVVYALVIQSGLAGTGKLLTFSTGIFAVYNGFVSSVITKDIAALRAPATNTP